MRTWFRDTVIENFDTQKLGGFDPYMNEYVLTINDQKIPSDKPCINCGVTKTFTFAQGEAITSSIEFCTNLSENIGDVVIDYFITSIDPLSEFEITVDYDGNFYSSGVQTGSGSFSFFKNTQLPSGLNVSVVVTGNVVISITVGCPIQEPMTLVEVVLTNSCDAGNALITQYNYTSGAYTSPIQSTLSIFTSSSNNPNVSLYQYTSGFEGQGVLPIDGSLMTLQVNQSFPYTTLPFDPLTDKFKYARANVLYANNNVDMQALLSISSTATPIINPATGIYNATFTVPSSTGGQFLYVIWDLRRATEAQLCYGATLDDVCCDCEPCTEPCSSYVFLNPSTEVDDAIVEFPLGTCFDPTVFTQVIAPGDSYSFCLTNGVTNYVVIEGEPITYMESCYCGF
jgi:hypothetical protein